jgi:hypothetical protein
MRRLLALLAAALLILAGCADSKSEGPDPADDPKGALETALDNLANSEGMTLTLTLDSTEESLTAAGEGDLPPDVAGKILDSSIVVSTKGDTPENAEFQMLIDVSGTEGFEIKSVGEEIYARADVRGLVETFGGKASGVDEFVAQAGTQPGFEFVEPAANGEWLHLTGAKELAEQFGAMPAASANEEMQKKIEDALRKALDENATVESEGTDDIGDHLVANLNIRGFYAGIKDTFASLIPQGVPAGQLPPESEVPDEDLKLDIWVADGTIEQVSFDFLQLAALAEGEADIPEGVDRLGLLLQFDPFDDSVEVPGDAVDVDLQQVMQGFFMPTGSATSSGSASSEVVVPEGAPTDMGDLCKELENAPDDVKAQFVEQCPDLVP